MKITQCDICKKTMERDEEKYQIARDGYLLFKHFEVCADCGRPVLKFLKGNRLIAKDEKKYERKK